MGKVQGTDVSRVEKVDAGSGDQENAKMEKREKKLKNIYFLQDTIYKKEGKKIKKYIYTMSLIFFQLHPALSEVPTCFKKKKTKLIKKPTKK